MKINYATRVKNRYQIYLVSIWYRFYQGQELFSGAFRRNNFKPNHPANEHNVFNMISKPMSSHDKFLSL